MSPTPSSLPEGSGWRVLPPSQADLEADALARTAPSAVRRSVIVPEWGDRAWGAAVAGVERAFETRGVEDGTPGARRWQAVLGRGLVTMETAWVPGGSRLTLERTWGPRRPWLLALALVCEPTALMALFVMAGREVTFDELGAVVALALVPTVGIVWRSAWEWMRALRAVRTIRRVLDRAERVGWAEAVVWVDAVETDGGRQGAVEAAHVEALPQAVGPARWLSDDEVEGLIDARPAVVTKAYLRRARRVVERATAERRPPAHAAPTPAASPASELPDDVPEGFAEWQPDTTAWE